jgi:hypothetical protein
MSQNSDPQDREPSLLEYARFHGLALNHLHFDHFEDLRNAPDTVDLSDPASLPILEFTAPPREDDIQCSREVATFIASAVKIPALPSLESMLPRHCKTPDFKMDLPLLKTDHDQDMREFGVKEDASATMVNLIFIEIDEAKDEGFSWPAWYEEYPKKCMKALYEEKLDIPKETILYLQTLRRRELKTEDMNAIFDGCLRYEMVGLLTGFNLMD